MNNKIFICLIAILVIGLGVSFALYHGGNSAGTPTGINSINFTPSSQYGDTYAEALNGIPYVIPTFNSALPYPTILSGDFVQGLNGWSTTSTTSTTITPAQFCATASQLITATASSTTTTLPAATSTYVACGSPLFGSYSVQLIDNESTNTAVVVAGTGTTFRCETNGVGTTTVVGGCTSSQVNLNATSSAWVTGFWTASGTQILLWGNEFH